MKAYRDNPLEIEEKNNGFGHCKNLFEHLRTLKDLGIIESSNKSALVVYADD